MNAMKLPQVYCVCIYSNDPQTSVTHLFYNCVPLQGVAVLSIMHSAIIVLSVSRTVPHFSVIIFNVISGATVLCS